MPTLREELDSLYISLMKDRSDARISRIHTIACALDAGPEAKGRIKPPRVDVWYDDRLRAKVQDGTCFDDVADLPDIHNRCRKKYPLGYTLRVEGSRHPIIYVYRGDDDFTAHHMLAEDGTALGMVLCSTFKVPLPDDDFGKHYPNGYRVVYVQSGQLHPGLRAAKELQDTKEQGKPTIYLYQNRRGFVAALADDGTVSTTQTATGSCTSKRTTPD